jgi:HAD superfamily hydrolase (TIGR01509 family)
MEASLPRDKAGQDEAVAAWHRRKTEIYTAMVADGKLPGRPGIRRIIAAAAGAGWQLAVASTSAEPSVRAVLEHVAGPELAAGFAVFAGDVVPAKKPAPDIYLLAVRELGADPHRTVVVEDSRNGLLAATGAGLPALITVNGYTAGEDFTGAALVVTSLGDPGEPATVLANRTTADPGALIDLTDLEACMAVPIGVPDGG